VSSQLLCSTKSLGFSGGGHDTEKGERKEGKIKKSLLMTCMWVDGKLEREILLKRSQGVHEKY
jgi:hypothetical protein